jgi:hypothetical protein
MHCYGNYTNDIHSLKCRREAITSFIVMFSIVAATLFYFALGNFLFYGWNRNETPYYIVKETELKYVQICILQDYITVVFQIVLEVQ